MARIRTIKPEFCTSEQVAECSPTARLLFVTMWMFCDDGGNHPNSVKRLKMECFPGDGFTDDEMQLLIDELVNTGLLVEYEANGKEYLHVCGWHHQKIDKPNFRYPKYEDCLVKHEFDDHSDTIRRPFDDHSTTTLRTLDDHSTNGRLRTGPDRSLPESTYRSISDRSVDEFLDFEPEVVESLASQLAKVLQPRSTQNKELVWACAVIANSRNGPEFIEKACDVLGDVKPKKPFGYLTTWLRNQLRMEKSEFALLLTEINDHRLSLRKVQS